MTIIVLKRNFKFYYGDLMNTKNCTQPTLFLLSPSQQNCPYQPQATHNKCQTAHLYWRRKHSPGNGGNELVSAMQVAELPPRPPDYLRIESDLLIKQVPKT
jgi:hypothetical protein